MGAITLDGVSKRYPNGVEAVAEISLEIGDGEFMVLVGPSGCGKSTLLRMIAGLEEVTGGAISIGGREVTHESPRHRNVAMVFQNYALYPQMTVRQNLGFGLKLHKTPKVEIAERVEAVARTLGLDELLERKPAELSGGQRQRVAMGRAMIREPAVFLMDEPLSNLDAKLRVSMRASLAKLHDRLGVTTVYVTHDQVEAMTLGQRVAVLRDGTLQQCATPQALYRKPVNLFTAAFIGSPSINLVEATITDGFARFGSSQIPLPAESPMRRHGRVILGIRPTDLWLAADNDPSLPTLRATIDVVEDLGAQQHLGFTLDAPKVTTDSTKAADDGEDGGLIVEHRARFVAVVGERRRVRSGEVVDVAVRTEALHAFDCDTGAALS
jgi:multiple sugar transport system ATP-binding protein